MKPFVASYLVNAKGRSAEQRAEDLALEQTVELPRAAVTSPFVLEQPIGAGAG